MTTGTPIYDVNGREMVGQPGTPVTISFDGSVASASALSAGQMYVFQADKACHIVFGATPTATVANMPLAANVPYYLTPLTAVKVAAIKATGGSAGTLWMTPMTGYTG